MGKTLHSFGRAALLALGALVLVGCGRSESRAPSYNLDACKRVDLINAESGLLVRGAEDIAIDWEGGRVFVSAYDRRAVEAAARRGVHTLPEGGIYAVPLADLFEADRGAPLPVTSLVAASDVAGGLHPHGLTLDANSGELFFINRAYARDGKKWRMAPELRRIGVNGEAIVGPSMRAPCAANNLIVSPHGAHKLLTTFDHHQCDWRAGAEDVFSLKRSGVATLGGDILFNDLSYANGVARAGAGKIAVGATRENAVVLLDEKEGGVWGEHRRVKTSGAPDNLTEAADGALVAALHPSLMRLALNRKLGLGKAPSRIVKIDLMSGRETLLFDDPKGALFSAATVGVETDAGLIAGSVTDQGLLVCGANE
ncbi:MAG: hypothetical protein AAGA09_02350 [Pseudomonadota bacterium]